MQQPRYPAQPGGAKRTGWSATPSQLLPFLFTSRGDLRQRMLLLPIGVLLVASLVLGGELKVLLDKGSITAAEVLLGFLVVGAMLLVAYCIVTSQRAVLLPVGLLAVGLAMMLYVVHQNQGLIQDESHLIELAQQFMQEQHTTSLPQFLKDKITDEVHQIGVKETLVPLVLTAAVFLLIYQLSGSRKPIWFLSLIAVATMLLLWAGGGSLLASLETYRSGFWVGIVEESFKALPVLGVYLLGRRLRSPHREALGIWDPLDGVLVACASASGFALAETLLAYNEPASVVTRPLLNIGGHLAFSGFLGYAIGLAVLKPGSGARALTIGFAAAVGMHALWDDVTFANDFLGTLLLTVPLYVVFASAILKAREISPSSTAPVQPMPKATPAPVVPPTPAKITTGDNAHAVRGFGAGQTAQPRPLPATSGTTAMSLRVIYLRIGSRRVALGEHVQLREGDIPGLTARTGGIVADVTVSPKDPAALGLRNLSTVTWTATPPNASALEVAHGLSVRLREGTTIVFGATAGQVEYV